MIGKIEIWQIIIGIALSASFLLIDLSLPLGVAGGVPYVALVCLGLWLPRRTHVIFLAIVSTALTSLGYLFSELGGELWVVLANRGLALFAIWITAFLLVYIKSAGANLAESEERFRNFAELGADWFWEMDENLRFTFCSERFREITGRDPVATYGQERRVFIDPLLENKNDEKWKQHFSQLEAHNQFREFNYRLLATDGRIVQISLSGNPVFSDDGKFRGYRGTGSDITERSLLEEQIRRSQKMEAVGQLTGGIAHDFNNILGIVQGNFEILQRMLKDNDKAKTRIEAGLRGAARGAALTRKLLDFSRKEVTSIQRISINGFIRDMEDLITKSLTVSISVKLHLDEDTWLVDIDPGDLQDAIINLALNARDAMPDGGKLVVESRNKVLDEKYAKRTPDGKAGEFVMLSVSDTGHGMTTEVKEHVLEPFFTTKEQGKGTGLGLSMVYGFVQRFGGHLEIYSEPGKGTTFHLYLPRAEKKLIGNQVAEMAETGSLPTGTGMILVVDDEEDLREIAVLYLESLGYQTRIAENGDKALEFLSDNHDIDLLFSDVVMPGEKDGYQLAETAHQRYPELKVLLTSGFTRKRSELHSAGDKYLVDLNAKILDKPYNLSELAFAVQATFHEQD